MTDAPTGSFLSAKLPHPTADHLCLRCNGSGESRGVVGDGPDSHEIDIVCPVCKGTGDRCSCCDALPDLLAVARKLEVMIARHTWTSRDRPTIDDLRAAIAKAAQP